MFHTSSGMHAGYESGLRSAKLYKIYQACMYVLFTRQTAHAHGMACAFCWAFDQSYPHLFQARSDLNVASHNPLGQECPELCVLLRNCTPSSLSLIWGLCCGGASVRPGHLKKSFWYPHPSMHIVSSSSASLYQYLLFNGAPRLYQYKKHCRHPESNRDLHGHNVLY